MAIAQSIMAGSSVVQVRPSARSKAFIVCKRGVQFVFLLLVLPRLLIYLACKQIIGRRAFGAASESIAKVPGLRGVYLRQAFYKKTLASCGKDAYFGWNSVFSMHETSLGDRAYIGRFCSIGFAEINAEAMLADHVQILSGGHEHTRSDSSQSMHAQNQHYEQTRIGVGAWIGAGAVIMADVGNHAIIGAGSVVSKPIPDYSVAVGIPARVIKTLPHAAD